MSLLGSRFDLLDLEMTFDHHVVCISDEHSPLLYKVFGYVCQQSTDNNDHDETLMLMIQF